MQAAVGHQQRQFHRPAVAADDRAGEDGLEVRGEPVEARADDHDVVRAQVVEVVKGVEQGVMEDLGLPGERVAAVDRDG